MEFGSQTFKFAKACGKGALIVAGGSSILLGTLFAAAAVGAVGYGVASGVGLINDGSYGINAAGWFSTVGALSTIGFCGFWVGDSLLRRGRSLKIS